MRKYFVFLVSTVFIFNKVNAQLPNSDVWLFSYSVKAGNYSFTEGKNISNHPGYDNQPFFSKDGTQILYTSERDGGQTDIYSYEIKSGQNTRKIQSKVSEYSPEFIRNNKFITDVVVEEDSTQRLWCYQMSGKYPADSLKARVLLSDVKNVAYSRWYNDSIVFLCILPEPMNLFVANVQTGKISKCAMNVNRSMCVLHQKKRDLFLYSQMKADSSYAIQALNSTGAHV
ncbi:MAG TPA: hypothetical protein VFJ43_01780, partial [Bacteroidia bacterium]|nr:hypothetical protein [Bacteroidia bacterium]